MEFFQKENLEHLLKCSTDVVYFANNFIQIHHPVYGETQLTLSSEQEDIIRSYQDNEFVESIGSRQVGLTILLEVYTLWFSIFRAKKNDSIIIMSHSHNSSEYMIRNIMRMIDKLPEWFILNATFTKRSIHIMDRKIDVISAGNREFIYRLYGKNIPLTVVDNAQFCKISEEILEELMLRSKQAILSTSGVKNFITRGGVARNELGYLQMLERDFKAKMIGMLGKEQYEREYGIR